MMPAMSPFMTEGTITRWEKKEGDAFLAGDVLLQVVRAFTRQVLVMLTLKSSRHQILLLST